MNDSSPFPGPAAAQALRLELAMRGANDGLWDWNLLTDEVFFSPRWKEMLGYSDAELPNHLASWSDNVHPEDLPRARQAVDDYLAGRSPEYRIELRMRHKDGSNVEILARGTVVRDAQGMPVRLIGTHVDITAQKQMEMRLRESEKRFRTMFDATEDAMALLNQSGFFDCNQATLRMFGCATREEFCRKHPAELSPPRQPDGSDSFAKANDMIAVALARGKHFFEWSHRRGDGEAFPAEVQLTAMHLDGERVLHGTIRDVTARKQAEQQLQQQYEALEQANRELNETQAQLLQSEKLASIGQLAAGVAHEINNPIGYVNSNLGSLRGHVDDLLQLLARYQALESRLPDDAEKRALLLLKQQLDPDFLAQDISDIINESLEGLGRVRRIVQDLKDFSHVDQATWETTDLHQGLDSTLNIVHNELKYKAEVVKEYGRLPPVTCLPSQLNQVFMNLLVNAGQAIEQQGRIVVRTGYEPPDSVWVEIEDNGCGIAPTALKRIFEPFFTTKEVGRGTGLGLSLAYGIIEKHRGRIEVESRVGGGSRFRIHLPTHQHGG